MVQSWGSNSMTLTCARYSRDSEKVAISSVNFLSFGKIFFYFFFDKLLDHYLIFPYLNSQIIWSSLDKRNNWSKKRFKKWNDICVVFIAHRLTYILKISIRKAHSDYHALLVRIVSAGNRPAHLHLVAGRTHSIPYEVGLLGILVHWPKFHSDFSFFALFQLWIVWCLHKC